MHESGVDARRMHQMRCMIANSFGGRAG
jgi:hypothetical protein